MHNDPHFTDKSQVYIMKNTIDKALSKNSVRALSKMTETVDGKLRIKSDTPLIVPIRDMVKKEKVIFDFNHVIGKALEIYKKSLPTERRCLIDQYEPIELAHKVVGVGSVGQRAWILVLMGRENDDPLVLQLKQAERSVLEAYYGLSEYVPHGERVVKGQRLIQTVGDILLGWLHFDVPGGGYEDYYVRQMWDAKGSFDIDEITIEGYQGLASMCAWTLAHAHAKTGDRHAITGYLGKNDSYEEAMLRYASAYADQSEADYDVFLKEYM